jgi:hypothetical protein
MAQDESKTPLGQQKVHEIHNAATGETQQITQERWRTEGKRLRAEGWERVDAVEEDEIPESETGE